MLEEEKMVEAILTTAEGKKILKRKVNIDNIFKIGSERDKILDSPLLA